MIVVGGVIPPQDVETLREAGAAAVFPPGTVIPDAAHDLVKALGTGPRPRAVSRSRRCLRRSTSNGTPRACSDGSRA